MNEVIKTEVTKDELNKQILKAWNKFRETDNKDDLKSYHQLLEEYRQRYGKDQRSDTE